MHPPGVTRSLGQAALATALVMAAALGDCRLPRRPDGRCVPRRSSLPRPDPRRRQPPLPPRCVAKVVASPQCRSPAARWSPSGLVADIGWWWVAVVALGAIDRPGGHRRRPPPRTGPARRVGGRRRVASTTVDRSRRRAALLVVGVGLCCPWPQGVGAAAVVDPPPPRRPGRHDARDRARRRDGLRRDCGCSCWPPWCCGGREPTPAPTGGGPSGRRAATRSCISARSATIGCRCRACTRRGARSSSCSASRGRDPFEEGSGVGADGAGRAVRDRSPRRVDVDARRRPGTSSTRTRGSRT